MDTALQNIKAIIEYIKGPYTIYFDAVVASLTEHMGEVKSGMDLLEQSGIELSKKVDEVVSEAQRALQEQEKKNAALAAKKSRSWWSVIGDWFYAPITWIQSGWATISSWVFGKKPTVANVAPAELKEEKPATELATSLTPTTTLT